MSTRSTWIMTFILVIVFFNQSLKANEWFESYNNTRTLSMGGAKIAITSDETSVFRNPANLGSIRGVFNTWFDPEMEGSTNFTDLITSKNTSKATDPTTILPIVSESSNRVFHAKTQLTPNLTVRNFSFGVLYRSEVTAIASSTALSTADIQYQNDFGVIMGVNYPLFGGVVKIGATAKAYNRIELVSSTAITSGTITMKDIASEGSAIAYDAGLLIQAPVAWIPTLAVVAHDIGYTKFDRKDGVRMRTSSQPNEIKPSIDSAVAISPILGGRTRSTFTIEYRDITNSRDETGSTKRLHFGSEFNINDIVYLRAGLNQGYYTAGFEISSEHTSWQFATYGEEIGDSDTKKEDRRYSARVVLRF